MVVLLAAAGAYGTTRSSLLDVDAVKVRGVKNTEAADVAAAGGFTQRRQMIDVDTRAVAVLVESLPWVRNAAVRRDWPGTIEISVSEREPAAVVVAPSGEHYAYVDGGGRVLGHAPAGTAELVLIHGLREVPAPGQRLDGADAALAVLRALGGRPAIAEIRAAGTSVEVVLPEGAVAIFGDDSELRDKVVALRTISARVDLAGVTTIDLRVPSAPTLTR